MWLYRWYVGNQAKEAIKKCVENRKLRRKQRCWILEKSKFELVDVGGGYQIVKVNIYIYVKKMDFLLCS